MSKNRKTEVEYNGPPIWDMGAFFTIGLLLALTGEDWDAKWWQTVLALVGVYALWPGVLGIVVGLVIRHMGVTA